MPRLPGPVVKHPRKTTYWWNDAIAEFRSASIRARRLWQRGRKRRRPYSKIEDLEEDYRWKKKELNRAIRKAKTASWKELIATIDKDSWGLPYRIVMNRLRQSSPSLSESLELETLDCLLVKLFPGCQSRETPLSQYEDFQWEEDWAVSYWETYNLLLERQIHSAVPGPDGFMATLWKKVTDGMIDRVTTCYNSCLKEGIFPEP